eukprot:jgi/Botrbrau1/11827/Bobra.0224s0023.1
MSLLASEPSVLDRSDGNTGKPGERASDLLNHVPLPYLVVDGKKFPLPGSHSVFLTGTTLKILGVQSEQDDEGSHLHRVPRDAIMQDIQFRGAISDFHPLKAVLQTADYEPLLLRSNPDDVYGDGNNFEVRPGHRITPGNGMGLDFCLSAMA